MEQTNTAARDGGNQNLQYITEKIDLAASFRWAARLNMHEAVANHFSLAVSDDGKKFLVNPNQRHFSGLCASDMLLLDADDPHVLDRPDAPDIAAWGLHGAIHRICPHARCVMHLHPIYSTVLASLEDCRLPPIDLNTATFFNRTISDDGFGGKDFKQEGARCAGLLTDEKIKVLVMRNHGIVVIGETVADAFNRLYYFERAAETYIKAKQTGMALNILSDEVAENTARQIENYPEQAERHFNEIKAILDRETPEYRS